MLYIQYNVIKKKTVTGAVSIQIKRKRTLHRLKYRKGLYMKIGINLQDIKQRNLKAILRVVNKHGQIPKKEIAEVLGMTPMTISNIANEKPSHLLVNKENAASA